MEDDSQRAIALLLVHQFIRACALPFARWRLHVRGFGKGHVVPRHGDPTGLAQPGRLAVLQGQQSRKLPQREAAIAAAVAVAVQQQQMAAAGL